MGHLTCAQCYQIKTLIQPSYCITSIANEIAALVCTDPMDVKRLLTSLRTERIGIKVDGMAIRSDSSSKAFFENCIRSGLEFNYFKQKVF